MGDSLATLTRLSVLPHTRIQAADNNWGTRLSHAKHVWLPSHSPSPSPTHMKRSFSNQCAHLSVTSTVPSPTVLKASALSSQL